MWVPLFKNRFVWKCVHWKVVFWESGAHVRSGSAGRGRLPWYSTLSLVGAIAWVDAQNGRSCTSLMCGDWKKGRNQEVWSCIACHTWRLAILMYGIVWETIPTHFYMPRILPTAHSNTMHGRPRLRYEVSDIYQIGCAENYMCMGKKINFIFIFFELPFRKDDKLSQFIQYSSFIEKI